MSKKTVVKSLGTSYESLVSTPASIHSVTVCNASESSCSFELAVKRGRNRYSLFRGSLDPGGNAFLFGGVGVTLEDSDKLEARSTASAGVDIACSYEETAGSTPLFNSASWNERKSHISRRGPTAAQAELPPFVLDALDSASTRWRSFVSYKEGAFKAACQMLPGWSGLELENYTEINSDNGYVASCGVNLYLEGGAIINSISFNLQVNRFYESKIDQQGWDDIMTHQMGHALGMGIFWKASNFFLSGFSFPCAQSAYENITSLTRNRTPLERLCGSGDTSSHWDSEYRKTEKSHYYGLKNEIMAGELLPGKMVISELSLGALKDFGYRVAPGDEEGLVLSTSETTEKQEQTLKCGLSCGGLDKVIGAMQRTTVATNGKFMLGRYIIA